MVLIGSAVSRVSHFRPVRRTNRSGAATPWLARRVKDNRLVHLLDVPKDYLLPIGSATGQGVPREILIAPASIDRVVYAAVELGFLGRTDESQQQLLVLLSPMIAVAVRSSKDRTRLEELLEETQRQAEELQTQQEELRVNNEELEEQGRALKESYAQMESQQAELEQTNAQLEEQTQLLEHQTDELTKQQDLLVERAAIFSVPTSIRASFWPI